MAKPKRHLLRFFCLILIAAFGGEQLVFAAGDLKPVRVSADKESIRLSYTIPASVAKIEDSHKILGSPKTVFLLQDAHTNLSGQLNLAKTLGILLTNEKDLHTVFAEAAVGDNSLSFLRNAKSLKEREALAASYIRKGLLHGAEYLDLTSEHNFKIWGVENPKLYIRSLEEYRRAAKDRERFELYLKKIRVTYDALSTKLLSPALKTMLERSEAFESGSLSLTAYFEALTAGAEKIGVKVDAFRSLSLLKDLKTREAGIDFKKANQEEALAVETFSSEDREMLDEASMKADASTFSGGMEDPRQGYFALLEEKMAGHLSNYPELFKYFDYLKAARNINTAAVLTELHAFEQSVIDAMALTPDEKTFTNISKMIRLYEKLFNLTLTPADYTEYETLKKSLDLERLTGFLNSKIMELKNYYDRSLFLEEGHEDILRSCETFYALTRERDQNFVKEMVRRMDETGETKAALVTGGFHTANLKNLLTEKGISFVSITPQVLRETNHARYESILLGQKMPQTSTSARMVSGTMDFVYARTGTRQGMPENLPGRGILFQTAGARLASEEIADTNISGPVSADALNSAALMGGSGFIGKHLMEYLRSKGVKTSLLVRPGSLSKLGEASKPHSAVIIGQLPDASAIREVIKGSGVIYHLASNSVPTAAVSDPVRTFEVVLGTARLVALAGSARIIRASSELVYSAGTDEIDVDEKSVLPKFGPETATGRWLTQVEGRIGEYVAANLMATKDEDQEFLARLLREHPIPQEVRANTYALLKHLEERIVARSPNGLSVRLSQVYGPGDVNAHSIVSKLIKYYSLDLTPDFPLWRNTFKRIIYVKDVVRILYELSKIKELPRERIVNVGSPDILSIEEIVRELQRVAGTSLGFTWIDPQKAGLPTTSQTQLMDILGKAGVTDFQWTRLAVGLRETVAEHRKEAMMRGTAAQMTFKEFLAWRSKNAFPDNVAASVTTSDELTLRGGEINVVYDGSASISGISYSWRPRTLTRENIRSVMFEGKNIDFQKFIKWSAERGHPARVKVTIVLADSTILKDVEVGLVRDGQLNVIGISYVDPSRSIESGKIKSVGIMLVDKAGARLAVDVRELSRRKPSSKDTPILEASILRNSQNISEALKWKSANEYIFGGGFGYDIRINDVVKDVDKATKFAYAMGRTFGGSEYLKGQGRALVTGDQRWTSDSLRLAFIQGLTDEGISVVTQLDGDAITTGLTSRKGLAEKFDLVVQLSGSHNPPEANGFKITFNGLPFFTNSLLRLSEDIGRKAGWSSDIKQGSLVKEELVSEHIDALVRILPAPKVLLPIIADFRSGVAGAPTLGVAEKLGYTVIRLSSADAPIPDEVFTDAPVYISLNDIPNGDMPSGIWDPSKAAAYENIKKLQKRIAEDPRNGSSKDFSGFVYDGDGDRSGANTGLEGTNGESIIIAPDRMLISFYQNFVQSNIEGIRALNKIGHTVRLALDVRASQVIVQVLEELAKKEGTQVEGDFIAAGYPTHRAFVLEELTEIQRLLEDKSKSDQLSPKEREAVQQLVYQYTSAEASGHFFFNVVDTELFADQKIVVDDGITSSFVYLEMAGNAGLSFLEVDRLSPALPVTEEVRLEKAPQDVQIKQALAARIVLEFAQLHPELLKLPYAELERKIAEASVKPPVRQSAHDDLLLVDGIRINLTNGVWVLFRKSNTSAVIVFKSEADSDEHRQALADTMVYFYEAIQKALAFDSRYSLDTSKYRAQMAKFSSVEKVVELATKLLENSAKKLNGMVLDTFVSSHPVSDLLRISIQLLQEDAPHHSHEVEYILAKIIKEFEKKAKRDEGPQRDYFTLQINKLKSIQELVALLKPIGEDSNEVLANPKPFPDFEAQLRTAILRSGIESPKRMMIVDDKATFQGIYSLGFKRAFPQFNSTNVVRVRTVGEFEREYELSIQPGGQPFDLVLIGNHLFYDRFSSGATGTGVVADLRLINKINSETPKTPFIILLTTNTLESIRKEANDLGIRLLDGKLLVHSGIMDESAIEMFRAAVYPRTETPGARLAGLSSEDIAALRDELMAAAKALKENNDEKAVEIKRAIEGALSAIPSETAITEADLSSIGETLRDLPESLEDLGLNAAASHVEKAYSLLLGASGTAAPTGARLATVTAADVIEILKKQIATMPAGVRPTVEEIGDQLILKKGNDVITISLSKKGWKISLRSSMGFYELIWQRETKRIFVQTENVQRPLEVRQAGTNNPLEVSRDPLGGLLFEIEKSGLPAAGDLTSRLVLYLDRKVYDPLFQYDQQYDQPKPITEGSRPEDRRLTISLRPLGISPAPTEVKSKQNIFSVGQESFGIYAGVSKIFDGPFSVVLVKTGREWEPRDLNDSIIISQGSDEVKRFNYKFVHVHRVTVDLSDDKITVVGEHFRHTWVANEDGNDVTKFVVTPFTDVLQLIRDAEGRVLDVKQEKPGARLAEETTVATTGLGVEVSNFLIGVAQANQEPVSQPKGARLALFDNATLRLEIFSLHLKGKALDVAYGAAQTANFVLSPETSRKLLSGIFSSQNQVEAQIKLNSMRMTLSGVTDVNTALNLLHVLDGDLVGTVGTDPTLDSFMLQAADQAKSGDKHLRLTVSDRSQLGTVLEYAAQKEVDFRLKKGALTSLFDLSNFKADRTIHYHDSAFSETTVVKEWHTHFYVQKPQSDGFVNFAFPLSSVMARVGQEKWTDSLIVSAFRTGMDPKVSFDSQTLARVVDGREQRPSIRGSYSQLPLLENIPWNEIFHMTQNWLQAIGRAA